MNAQISTLTRRCEETETRIQEHRKLLSAVRWLPMEILREIFLATVDFPPRMYQSMYKMWFLDSSPMTSLWDIELVSKGWRRALLSYARIWSHVIIRDASLFDRGYREVIRLGRQLQRAQNHPLSIFIHQPQDGAVVSSHLIVSLIPFASKIQTMHLSVSHASVPRFHPLSSFLVSLHSLSILSTDISVTPHLVFPNPFENTFRDAENLQRLELLDAYARIHQLSIPWRAIKHLKIINRLEVQFHHYTAFEDILEVLNIATTIEDLELQISLLSPVSPGITSPSTAPSLRSLKLSTSINHFGNFSALLDRLDMPSLSQLVVECADSTHGHTMPNQDIMRSFLGLLERSECLLTSLTLYDVRMTSYDMRSLFIRLPTLEELHLANVGNDTITNTILRKPTAIDKTPPAFPKLHTLHINGAWGFEPANFIKMVKSRCASADGYAQLRSVSVAWKAGVPDTLGDIEDRAHIVASELKDCDTDGLELSSFVYWSIGSR
ncbi:uncharacterized protein EV420DRAFT_1191084 [Desarmillaria tabescens]|uniref:F-box domain-containing protein n=1 Tax=Armillaria tabescens TaxID=1929756 RepID=A0AA39TXN7_ARMTA|nr:uncharacterized protein EV420DRAFT_1191084 [Desarmillaria tabescens]KAK0462495.1 hypothetical protein EV420DRAFT_1191084 [Desarmillaria tabescens]